MNPDRIVLERTGQLDVVMVMVGIRAMFVRPIIPIKVVIYGVSGRGGAFFVRFRHVQFKIFVLFRYTDHRSVDEIVEAQ